MQKKPLRTQAIVLAAVFLLALISANFLLAKFEWSQNIEESIVEAQMPTIVYAIDMLAVLLVLAPIAWLSFWFKKKKKGELTSWIWLTSILLVTVPIFILQERGVFLITIPLAVFGGMGVEMIYLWFKRVGMPAMPILILILAFCCISSLFYLLLQATLANSNLPVVEAAAWINENTAQNSTFLASWSDSSVIEGLGNRTTYTESVNANGTRINAYARLILAENGNYSYIVKVRPDYLFVSNSISATVYQEEANLTNETINMSNTNLEHLMSGNVHLPIVYSYNGVVIYNVTSLWKN